MIKTAANRFMGMFYFVGSLLLFFTGYFESIELLLAFSLPIFILFIAGLHKFETISMNLQGCTVSLFWVRRFYPWHMLKTIRLVDFSQALFAASRGGPVNCEGVIFCTHYIKKYPRQTDPDSYVIFQKPFCSFYIQFTPTGQYTEPFIPPRDRSKKTERPCEFPVDRELFLSCIEKWGVRVEGLNAPLPPEELEQKKKKRR